MTLGSSICVTILTDEIAKFIIEKLKLNAMENVTALIVNRRTGVLFEI